MSPHPWAQAGELSGLLWVPQTPSVTGPWQRRPSPPLHLCRECDHSVPTAGVRLWSGVVWAP